MSKIPNTIFSSSKIPSINGTSSENKKISFWLEKIFILINQIRLDNNRREKQFTDANNNQFKEEITSYKDQNFVQSGKNEYAKSKAAKKEADTEIVNDLVKKSNRCIISIKSQFPWDLFPNTIEVEDSIVIFKFNQFLSSQSHSVDIKDISNITIEYSFFSATLLVISRTFIDNEIKIDNLNKAKAKKVQWIIEGLRTFEENNINTSNYEIDELIAKIGEFHTNHLK